MSAPSARRILLIACLLFVPCPYLMAVEGSVPVARFAWLATVTATYAVFVDGSGVAWTMTLMLVAHGLVYGAIAWTLVRLLGAVSPRRWTVRGAPLCAIALALVCLAMVSYETPFGNSARATWWELFR